MNDAKNLPPICPVCEERPEPATVQAFDVGIANACQRCAESIARLVGQAR